MPNILIVDDDKSIRMLYAEELAEDGFDVITTGDGLKVIELIRKEDPDVIVMDIRLGKNNGLGLLQDIRKTHYDLPVILCTAYPNIKYDVKSIAADYYVAKSADLTELKLRIRMALAGRMKLPSSAVCEKRQRPEPIHTEQTSLNWTERPHTD